MMELAEFLTIEEAAQVLGISATWAWAVLNEHPEVRRAPILTFGRKRLVYNTADVLALREARRTPAWGDTDATPPPSGQN